MSVYSAGGLERVSVRLRLWLHRARALARGISRSGRKNHHQGRYNAMQACYATSHGTCDDNPIICDCVFVNFDVVVCCMCYYPPYKSILPTNVKSIVDASYFLLNLSWVARPSSSPLEMATPAR